MKNDQPASAPEPYGLRSLRHAAKKGYAVSISPSDAADVVAEIERRRAALDAERATVAALRASVPPVHPADYGHEAWTAALVDAKKEGARSAVEERDAERAAVVAWLRAEAYLTLYEATPSDVADAIESGEHRREETK